MLQVKRYVMLLVLFNNISPTYAEQTVGENTIVTTNPSYYTQVKDKALTGVTNIATGVLEIPKNVINTANAEGSNVLFGLTGGAAKGILNMIGRTGAGIADVATAFLPTKPIIEPQYVWQNFYSNTNYNDVYQVDNSKK